jgi:hypothetical protein
LSNLRVSQLRYYIYYNVTSIALQPPLAVQASGACAYLRRKGIRDIVFGTVVFGLVFGSYRPLSMLLVGAALIPSADFVTVFAYRRPRPKAPLVIHGGTA